MQNKPDTVDFLLIGTCCLHSLIQQRNPSHLKQQITYRQSDGKKQITCWQSDEKDIEKLLQIIL
jgi:hypothetical protein